MRIIGVEPTCLAALDPKSSASANFAISANASNYYLAGECKTKEFLYKLGLFEIIYYRVYSIIWFKNNHPIDEQMGKNDE